MRPPRLCSWGRWFQKKCKWVSNKMSPLMMAFIRDSYPKRKLEKADSNLWMYPSLTSLDSWSLILAGGKVRTISSRGRWPSEKAPIVSNLHGFYKLHKKILKTLYLKTHARFMINSNLLLKRKGSIFAKIQKISSKNSHK